MRKSIKTVCMGVVMAGIMAMGLVACSFASSPASAISEAQSETLSENNAKSSSQAEDASSQSATSDSKTRLQVFVAASLKKSMEEVAAEFNKSNPDVEIILNVDSSGKLMTQIQEGFACDVFFSAAKKQMDTLEADGFVLENTRKNVVNNQLTVIALKDSDTKVTGLSDLSQAKSIALADGSVPVGRYTRVALGKLGILNEAEDMSKITTKEVSEALGGVEISEQSNVSKVLAAVVEGSAEVGTVYYSDTYGFEDKVQVLETVSYDLTGNVIYPIACIKNEEADDAEVQSAKEFLDFVTSEDAKKIFEKYYFDTNVE